MEQTNLLEPKSDAARLMRISLRKLDMLIAEKRLKVVRIGRRVLISRKALEEFVRKSER